MDITISLDKIKDIYNGMDRAQKIKMTNIVKGWEQTTIELSKTNLQLQEYLVTCKGPNTVIGSSDIQKEIDNVDDKSLMVYVSNAQLYKIYQQNHLNDFINDDNTIYRKSETGPVHEVVRDIKPQKMTVIINKDLLDMEVRTIKNLLFEFIKKNPAFKLTISDIIVFKYDNKTEFMVRNLLLSDILQKEKLIKGFIKFLKDNDETLSEIYGLIELWHPTCDEVDGARFYKLPSAKNVISENTLSILDQLVSMSNNNNNQTNIVNINNPTIIIQNGHTNTSSVNITTEKNVKQYCNEFCEFLCETKPKWYVENGNVELSTIANAFRQYSGLDTDSRLLSRYLNGLIYDTKPTKNQRNTKKQLLTYTDVLKRLENSDEC